MMKMYMVVFMQTSYSEHIFSHTTPVSTKIFLLKMPLIDKKKQGGSLNMTEKQLRNFIKYNDQLPATLPHKSGDGILSSLGSLITAGTSFIKSNADVIKTGTQAISNAASAGKNINDAVNATKKIKC